MIVYRLAQRQGEGGQFEQRITDGSGVVDQVEHIAKEIDPLGEPILQAEQRVVRAPLAQSQECAIAFARHVS
ncbi:hypothetical protein B6D51_28690 [Pseudomonas chlororaphis subsp. chlororaphis]|nr:hypothetical protein B6D51_28690 [Pseudomonas chlororaphis subsp. chlororaphis]